MSWDQLRQVARRLERWADAQWQTWGPALLMLGFLLLATWLVAAHGLHGRRLARWLAVPALLAVALVCLAGPGHLFPKYPFEGPQLLRVSTTHALTALDLPGLAAGGAGGALGVWAVWERLTER